MVKQKKINGSGGVTIPSDVRRELGYDKGTAVDVEVKGGKIIISKRTPRCIFCGNVDKVIRHGNKEVCQKCVIQMGAKANGEG